MQDLWLNCANLFITAFVLTKNLAFASFSNEPYEEPESDYETIQCVNNPRHSELKYILLWTSSLVPGYGWGLEYKDVRSGQQCFIDRSCPFSNCFVTADVNFREDYTQFDAIAFFPQDPGLTLPERRSPHQKFVFVSTHPYKLRSAHAAALNGFFNWTWTFKLNSDLTWQPFVIRDIWENIVGPKPIMQWIPRSNMLPVNAKLKKILRKKTKAVAMFLSECQVPAKDYVIKLEQIMSKKYKLRLDIYGACFNLECSFKNYDICNRKIRRNYYFYLVFEKFCSEDYVSEELLRPMNYNSVPIVYGCADYTRFLPPKSYLVASNMTPAAIAATIDKLIHNITEYENYFKWTNHYTYQKINKAKDSDVFCRMCALMNDDTKVQTISVYTNFTGWWNQNPSLKDALMYEDALSRPSRRLISSSTLNLNSSLLLSGNLLSSGSLSSGLRRSVDPHLVEDLNSRPEISLGQENKPRSSRDSKASLVSSQGLSKSSSSNWMTNIWNSVNTPNVWQYFLIFY